MPMARCPGCDRGYRVAWFPGQVMIRCDCGEMFPASFRRMLLGLTARAFRRTPRLPKAGTGYPE